MRKLQMNANENLKAKVNENLRRYEQVAARVEQMILQGVLCAGDKAPSIRTMCHEQRCSPSTVFQAYYDLEDRGLLEARLRSGFYVTQPAARLPLITKISRPAHLPSVVKIHDLVAELLDVSRQPEFVPLGVTTIARELLPVDKLQRHLARTARSEGETAINYDWSNGIVELRRHIARRSRDAGNDLSPDDVVITAGCLEALTLALRAVAAAGDAIAVESPTYFGILQVIESLGMRALEIATDPQTGISLEALEAAIKQQRVKAVVVIANFNNPLGCCLSDEKKRDLVELLARREIPLIDDDIYGDLHFGETRPRTTKAFDRNESVILCSSFSKTLAPGYRVGWIAGGRFHNQIVRLKRMSSNGTSNPPQQAIAAFLSTRGYDRHLRDLRRTLARNTRLVTDAVTTSFPPKTRVSQPAGGFVLWLELPPATDALKLYNRARAEQIGVVPGTVFSAQGKYRNFIRLSCGHLFTPTIETAIHRLGVLCSAMK